MWWFPDLVNRPNISIAVISIGEDDTCIGFSGTFCVLSMFLVWHILQVLHHWWHLFSYLSRNAIFVFGIAFSLVICVLLMHRHNIVVTMFLACLLVWQVNCPFVLDISVFHFRKWIYFRGFSKIVSIVWLFQFHHWVFIFSLGGCFSIHTSYCFLYFCIGSFFLVSLFSFIRCWLREYCFFYYVKWWYRRYVCFAFSITYFYSILL